MITDNETDRLSGYVNENLTLQLKSEALEDESGDDSVENSLSTAYPALSPHPLENIQIDEVTPIASSTIDGRRTSYCAAVDFSLAQSKLESLINWSISAYRSTREILYEKLGKTARTVDVELEEGIDGLREVQRRYLHVLNCVQIQHTSLQQLTKTQHDLSASFLDLSKTDNELAEAFSKASDNQFTKSNNNSSYYTALETFADALQLLCLTTFEDTIATYKKYESARLEYDIERHNLEQEQTVGIGKSEHQSRLNELEQRVIYCRQKYERLRNDVQTKMRLLHDNKVNVLQNHLRLFGQATCDYFSGKSNQTTESLMLKSNVNV